MAEQKLVREKAAPAARHGAMGLLQRKCPCGGSAGLAGECESCRQKKLVGVHPLGQVVDGRKNEVEKNNGEIYGHYLFPEVVVRANQSSGPSKADYGAWMNEKADKSIARRDATFVKVTPPIDLDKRRQELNRQAQEELLEHIRLSQGTLRDGSPQAERKAKQAEEQKIKDYLKRTYGDWWGTFWWWMRGGDKYEMSPVWNILGSMSVLNKSYPVMAYPYQSRVYAPSQLPYIPKTEEPLR